MCSAAASLALRWLPKQIGQDVVVCRSPKPVPAAQERGRRTRSKDCVPVIEDHYVLPRERLQQLNELEKQRQREVFQLIEPGEHPLPAAGRGGWQ